MNAVALEAALRALGIEAEILPEGAVAVMRIIAGDAPLNDAATRRALVALAESHGFRNLALEVAD